MYTNIFKAARQGKLLVAEDGVRILGRTYKKNHKVRFRVNMNRMSLKKLLLMGLLKISDSDTVVKETKELSNENTNQRSEGLEGFEGNEDDQEFTEKGCEGDVIEESIEGDSVIQEPDNATELEGTIIEPSTDLENDQEDSNQLEEPVEGTLEGSEVEIEESVTEIPSKEDLLEMTLNEIRVIANPLGLSSNSKEKLIDKLLAL